jgi:hypothetical protein
MADLLHDTSGEQRRSPESNIAMKMNTKLSVEELTPEQRRAEVERRGSVWVLVAITGCAALAIIGWVIAIYVNSRTPEITHVLVVAPNRPTAEQNKGIYLFTFPFVQFWILFMAVFWKLRWRSFVRRTEKSMRPPDITVGSVRNMDFVGWCKFLGVALLVGNALMFCGTSVRALHLLNLITR